MTVLSCDDLSVRFGEVRALDHVSVDIRPGEVLMLAGPNGAGKSTLVQIILGLVRADSGCLKLDGVPVEVNEAFKAQIGYLPESVAFSDSLSAIAVLKFFARARGVEHARIREVLELVGLYRDRKRVVRGYSRGMKQRLGLAVAVLAEPEILVLDEPTGGLDQEGLKVLFRILDIWRSRNRKVVLATHDLVLLERRVQQICILKTGRVVACGTPESLRRQVALPVRVTLDLLRPIETHLLNELEQSGFEVVPGYNGQMTLSVEQSRLLELTRWVVEHDDDVGALAVKDAELDRVYERFLELEV